MGKGPEKILLQKGHTDDPQTYEKMLNVTSHQRDEIKTTMRYHFTPDKMALINNQQTSAAEDMEKREP